MYAVDNRRDRSWAQAPFLECGAALAAVGVLQGVKIRVKVENAQLRRAIPLYVQSKELRMIRPTLAYAVLALLNHLCHGTNEHAWHRRPPGQPGAARSQGVGSVQLTPRETFKLEQG